MIPLINQAIRLVLLAHSLLTVPLCDPPQPLTHTLEFKIIIFDNNYCYFPPPPLSFSSCGGPISHVHRFPQVLRGLQAVPRAHCCTLPAPSLLNGDRRPSPPAHQAPSPPTPLFNNLVQHFYVMLTVVSPVLPPPLIMKPWALKSNGL